MGEAKQCQYCDSAATIHLTQIVDKKIHKINLCESCAEEQGLTQPEDFSLDNLLQMSETETPAVEDVIADDDVICEKCGSTFQDFQKSGRLGSSECYEVFKDRIEPMLRDMHRGIRHVGKFPAAYDKEAVHAYAKLQKDLARAVKEERFEDAARIRDEIENHKNSLSAEK